VKQKNDKVFFANYNVFVPLGTTFVQGKNFEILKIPSSIALDY
jgi:hypothetical protein